jgi:hypothetical protein
MLFPQKTSGMNINLLSRIDITLMYLDDEILQRLWKQTKEMVEISTIYILILPTKKC